MAFPIYAFLILFATMLVFLFLGQPVAFALGGVATFAIFIIWGWDGAYVAANAAYSTFMTENYLAIPMFLLLANFLQKSGIADDLYEMLYNWMGGLKGGLAMGTVIICAIFGAMCGGSGPATITMGLIALPSMLKRGYNKEMAVGCIAAGGVLGIIIPPSIAMIILAGYGQLSVGKLFFSGILPGVMCAVIYCIYIGIRCSLNPTMGPPIPVEERADWNKKIKMLGALVGPLALILLVLGSIYGGIATPTESAAIGAFGALVLTFLKRRLTLVVFAEAVKKTFILTSMILWILIAANMFNVVYNYMGAFNLLSEVAAALPGGKWTVLACCMLLNFVLGCLMDDFAIISLTAPLYMPLMVSLGFDPLWFALVFMMNLQMAYITPPFGFNIFYLRSIVPKDILVTDIYRAVIPFVGLQLIALILCIVFPQIALYIPNTFIK